MEIKITEQKDRLVATLAAILTCCLMLTAATAPSNSSTS